MREPSVDRRHEPAVERPGSTRAELPALAAVLGLLGTCDALLLAAAAYGRMGPVYGLVLHAALMGVAAASAQHRIVGDRTPWVIGLVATAIAGPLGALGGNTVTKDGLLAALNRN